MPILTHAGPNSAHCHMFNSLDLSYGSNITLPKQLTAHAESHSGPFQHPGKDGGHPKHLYKSIKRGTFPMCPRLHVYVQLHDLS